MVDIWKCDIIRIQACFLPAVIAAIAAIAVIAAIAAIADNAAISAIADDWLN